MTREERENALHCLKVMIDEEVCEECNLYGTTGTDHCEHDCVRVAIKALEQEPTTKNDLGVDADKLIADCEKMSFDFELFGRPTKALLLDAVKNIVKDLPSVTPQEPRKSRDMEEIEEVINCDADAEIKCKIISNILTAKPHYFEEPQESEKV